MTEFPTPDLGDDRILRIVAGVRPCRRGGLRLEVDRAADRPGPRVLVHNYGQGGCGITIGFGCAQVAADLLETELATNNLPRRVAVLGGGVIGLTAARELLQRGHAVTLYAEKFAGETTSIRAGAVWLPTGVDFNDSPRQRAFFLDILRRSRRAFAELDRDRFGVEALPIYEPAEAVLHREFFDNGTIDPPVDLPALPVGALRGPGRTFTTDFIHTPRFLRELQADIEQLGGRLIRRRFESIDDLADLEEPAAFNCLALGSRTLFGDTAMYGARGILIHLAPQPLGYIVHNEYRYMFPREDALILGGTFEPGVESAEPDEAAAASILRHHRAFFGQIGSAITG